eukprot:scaffold71_cov247-Pinguiococcus_pyrenoidosus.AAC.20
MRSGHAELAVGRFEGKRTGRRAKCGGKDPRKSAQSCAVAPELTWPASSTHFVDIGAAYGTAKSGVGIASMGVTNPEKIMRNLIPVVMAGVLGIYGLIVAVILNQGPAWLLGWPSVLLAMPACARWDSRTSFSWV